MSLPRLCRGIKELLPYGTELLFNSLHLVFVVKHLLPSCGSPYTNVGDHMVQIYMINHNYTSSSSLIILLPSRGFSIILAWRTIWYDWFTCRRKLLVY